MSEKRIPKKDRAYLYFRENGRGYLNIKFGPEQYTNDTQKFYEILMVGVLQAVTFLSNVGENLTFEERQENYETLRLAFQAILFEAFPDIKKMMDDETAIEELVDQAVESGEKILAEDEEEFQKQKSEAKKRYRQIIEEQYAMPLEEIKKEIIGSIEIFENIIERLQGKKYIKENQRKILLNLISNAYIQNLQALEDLEKKEE